MQKRTKLKQQLLIATCAAAIGTSAGCRATPKWNLLGNRSTPSAETLAGKGPTGTFPPPPSETASPTAIASVAGGTAEPSPDTRLAAAGTKPVTGFDTAARKSAAKGPSSNLSAAAANGFNLASGKSASSASAAQLPSYGQPESSSRPDPNAAVPAVPAGYQFGGSPTASDEESTKTASSPTAWNLGSGKYRVPSSYAMPEPADAPPPPSGYAMPSSQKQAADKDTSATSAPAAGFALPSTGLAGASPQPAAAKPFTPKTDSMATAQLSPPTGDHQPTAQAKGFTLPESGSTPASTAATGSKSASFSTASATLTPRATPPTSPQASTSGGYAPGSTSASGGYPTTSGYPGTGNSESFYR